MLKGINYHFTPASDNSVATWVIDNLQGFAESVTSIVPAGFAAYARVYHPAWKSLNGVSRPVRWSDIAKVRGKHPHEQMQWPNISGGDPYGADVPSSADIWSEAPDAGTLPIQIAALLQQTLALYTATPERCWFAVWAGFGYLRQSTRSAPTFTVPDRNMYLFSAPIQAITTSFGVETWIFQSANLWWPDDHSWCVATEVDLMTTYVAASNEAITALLKLSELEVDKVKPSDGVQWKSDILNPVRE